MAAALALGGRGKGLTGLNPSVGCVIVKHGHIIGRGWTQNGGRPHAEAMALAQAGDAAQDSTIYVTLEPCAHESARGPSCAQLLAAAKPERIVFASEDPDPRTAGKGAAILSAAGITLESGVLAAQAQSAMAGFFSRIQKNRPYVTLKLATSLDGAIAMRDGESKWITGDAARAHTHLERARSDMILVGGGTYRADSPRLNVRLPGLETRSTDRVLLSNNISADGWQIISAPEDIAQLPCNNLFVEGGAQTAASFVRANLVDRLLLYRAPIMIGDGKACLGDIGLSELGDAHGKWRLQHGHMLGKDRLEIYIRNPEEIG